LYAKTVVNEDVWFAEFGEPAYSAKIGLAGRDIGLDYQLIALADDPHIDRTATAR